MKTPDKPPERSRDRGEESDAAVETEMARFKSVAKKALSVSREDVLKAEKKKPK